MNQVRANRRISHALSVIILILPFFMFHWMIPFVSDVTLGNDYGAFAIKSQLELLFSLKTGSFPLYHPGYAGGHTSAALTMGQLFHPTTYLAVSIPGYWNGRALECNTLIRFFSLGLAHLMLFTFLKRIKLGNLISFIFSLITVYNLRMLDLFRYGGDSLESWTGHIAVCAAIGLYCLKPTKLCGPLIIVFAIYWLVTSGHPQMMYFGMIGAFLFILIIPYFLATILPDRNVDFRNVIQFWLCTGFCCCLGILLASAYLLPFYFDFLTTNDSRVASSYAWADGYRDTFIGTLNNFFQPLRSDVHGVFGGSSLFLLAALVPVLWLFRMRIPRVIWVIWCFALVTFMYIQGERTAVHYLSWKFLPFFSSVEVAGRLSMIIPMLLMLILIWVMQAKAFRLRYAGWKVYIPPRTMLSAFGMVLMCIYVFIPQSYVSSFGTFSPTEIRQIPEWVLLLTLFSGVAALFILVIHGTFQQHRIAIGIVLCLVTCIQIKGQLHYGTWIAPGKDSLTFEQMLKKRQQKLQYSSLPGSGMYSAVVIQQLEKSFLEPFMGKIYRKFVVTKDNDEAYALMAKDSSPDQVIVENYHQIGGVSANMGGKNNSEPDRVDLIYSSYNRLIFDIWTLAPGFFGFSYPYTGHWKASLNSRNVHIYRANGASHAVQVPAGYSRIEFRYWSSVAFGGMALSCATLSLLGLIIGFKTFKKLFSVLMAIIFSATGITIFFLWYHSLYTGENLDTEYSWKMNGSSQISNLAYGKRTWISSIFFDAASPHEYHSGLAVDGDCTPKSGFVTHLQPNPWWIIDLYKPESIGSIKLFESRQGLKWNTRPLVIMLSNDEKEWFGKTVLKYGDPLNIEFQEPLTAQYIKLEASDVCLLSMDEIEIYPPPEHL